MVSSPNTHKAEKQDKSVKFGINSVHTQKLPSENKMEATNQQTGLPIFSNNYQTDRLTATNGFKKSPKEKMKQHGQISKQSRKFKKHSKVNLLTGFSASNYWGSTLVIMKVSKQLSKMITG